MDDEVDFLKAAKQILEMKGPFHIDVALSVREAREKMKEEEYDAIVSDYFMPEMDGLQFLRELRDSGNPIPFIMFTVLSKDEFEVKTLSAIADWFLSKSGDPEIVYGKLIKTSIKS